MQMMQLKDVQGQFFGSVFLDNLTLSCALRTVSNYRSESLAERYDRYQNTYGINDAWYYRQHHGRKWDYELNDTFRFAIDIFSLAQVVEAIVMFDKIFVDSSHVNRWSVLKQDDGAKGIEHLIVPINLDPIERLELLNLALDYVRADTDNNGLQDFFTLLSQTSTESVFIHMSHGYFDTGYSDQVVFSDISDFSDQVSIGLLQEMQNIGKQNKTSTEEVIKRLELIADLSDRFKNSVASLLQLQEDNIQREGTKMVLGKTEFFDGDIHDKLIASQDIIRNAIAAHFYDTMALNCGISYFPHLMRSNFILYNQVLEQRGSSSTAQSILRCLQEFRTKKLRSIETFYRGSMVDLTLPFLLAMVLKNVSQPEDVLEATLELRESKHARDFRSWIIDIDQKIATGNISLDTLSQELNKIKKYIGQWTRIKDIAEQGTTTWTVSIPLGPTNVGIPVPLRMPSLSSLRPLPRHFTFLQRIAQLSNNTARFDTLIAKVFGPELGSRWRQYHQTLDKFALPPTTQQGKRLSPLSKE